MSIKDKLLKLKDKIHTTEYAGEKLHYKLMKTEQRAIIREFKDEHQDAMIFIECFCDEKGKQIFTRDEIEDVLALPSKLVSHMVMLIVASDEKKLSDD